MKLPEQVSESVKRRNPHLYDTAPHLSTHQFTSAVRQKKRIRQFTKPLMNKLEREWYLWILDRYADAAPIRIQAKTYKLANGVKYTPDFTCSKWIGMAGRMECETAWEVKGPHAWDDAIVKLKVAASVFPEVQWILVTKENGRWKQQVILP